MTFEGYFDSAQICLNGHLITAEADTCKERTKRFCPECAGTTIIQCENCSEKIKGLYKRGPLIDLDYNVPKFCDTCGTAYPWTIKKLDAVKELIELSEQVSSADKAEFYNNVTDLVKEGPRSPIAIKKIQKVFITAGKEISQGVKDIIVDIVSESVKKTLWGP